METGEYILSLIHIYTRKGAMNSVYHWVRNYMLGRKAVSYTHLSAAFRRSGVLHHLRVLTGEGSSANGRCV